MIEFIKGKIEIKTDEYIVVSNETFGYRVYTSLNTLADTGVSGDNVKLYTHMYIREDVIMLYGFSTMEELSIFKLLISVSGVGPKAGMAVLSVTTPATFSIAVVSDDADTLSKAQGVGKKTAQRIILELKDKIKKNKKDMLTEDIKSSTSDTQEVKAVEAVNALVVLGYGKKEAVEAVNRVIKECETLEEVIKMSLKKLTAGIL